MGACIACLVFKRGKEKVGSASQSLYDIEAATVEGKSVKLRELITGNQKWCLVVNVASK